MDGFDLSGPKEMIERPVPYGFIPAVGKPSGMIVACPHSGRFYPPEMLSLSHLDALSLRRSEDAFVDMLFEHAPNFGADLFVSQFARAFVDLNRDAEELDPELIADLLPVYRATMSSRVQVGLGVIPRTVGDDIAIYQSRLDHQSAQNRLDEVYRPWHGALSTQLNGYRQRLGRAFILDCHSMPDSASGNGHADVILGDRFGTSCSPAVTERAAQILRDCGLKLQRNDPYSGGYTTSRYGKPETGVHALQIEINRSLYMIEGAMTRRPEFDAIANIMTKLVVGLSTLCATL